MEWKEGKGTPPIFSESPSIGEFTAFCKSIHCGIAADWFIKDKFMAQDVKGWSGIPDWRKYALRVRGWWDNAGRPMSPQGANGEAVKTKQRGWIRDAIPSE